MEKPYDSHDYYAEPVCEQEFTRDRHGVTIRLT